MTNHTTRKNVPETIKSLFKITLIIFFICVILATMPQILMLIFIGLLFGLFLRGTSLWLSKKTHLKYPWCLTIFSLVFAVTLTTVIILATPGLTQEMKKVSQNIPTILERAENQIRNIDWLRQILTKYSDDDTKQVLPPLSKLLAKLPNLFSTAFGITGTVLIIIMLGLFFSAEPKLYQSGMIQLCPRKYRQLLEETLHKTGTALKLWIRNRFASMLLVGILTYTGLLILNIPLAFTLTLLAMLLTFIPNFGPILSAIPAIVFAYFESPEKALYIIFLYSAIQTVESYIFLPLLDEKTLRLPPALTVSVQLAFGYVFGALGLFIATPLLLSLIIVIKIFYLREHLHESVNLKTF